MPYNISSFIITYPSGIIFKVSLTNCTLTMKTRILATEFTETLGYGPVEIFSIVSRVILKN